MGYYGGVFGPSRGFKGGQGGLGHGGAILVDPRATVTVDCDCEDCDCEDCKDCDVDVDDDDDDADRIVRIRPPVPCTVVPVLSCVSPYLLNLSYIHQKPRLSRFGFVGI